MAERLATQYAATFCILLTAACGNDPAPPLQVAFGETTFVVVLNPVVNDGTSTPVPTPGTMRSGVAVSVDDGPSATTAADGVTVLSPVASGTRTLSVSGGGQGGDVSVDIAAKDLKEVAVALDASGAAVMREIVYPFGGQVVEVTPSTPISEVNAQLAMSNVIVFFRGGTYTGDLSFSGSGVTLFGEGDRGGLVTIQGNVVVDGSSNRIRGARITGDLSVPGSDAGISFSRVDGSLNLSGSSAVLLNNVICGAPVVSGSDSTLLGNAGISPVLPDC